MNIRESVRLKILSAIIPATTVTLIAMGFALYQLHSVSNDFIRFVERDVARLNSYGDMYEGAINGGLAIRNLILDPRDAAAKASLVQANADFKTALDSVNAMAAPGARDAEILGKLEGRREMLQDLRDMYVEIAGTLADTGERFVREEAPLWRDVKHELAGLREAEIRHFAEIKADMVARANLALSISIALAVVALILGGILTLAILGRVRQSLVALRDSMHAIAQGEGNLKARIAVAGDDEIGQTSQAFNKFLEKLHALVLDAQTGVSQVATEISQVSDHIHQVTRASNSQSDAAGQASYSMQQLNVHIASVANTAEEVRDRARESVSRTEFSDEKMIELTNHIEQLQKAINHIEHTVNTFVTHTAEITNMTGQVSDIAEQTNLLALNAAIEAARAGDQGRGFAVVADEVRKLAEKSGESANRIKSITMMLESQSGNVAAAIQNGNVAISTSAARLIEARQALEEAKASTTQSGEGVNRIVDFVNEQLMSSQSVARNVDDIARMIDSTRDAVEQTFAAIKSIDAMSAQLNGSFARFQT
ncbi:MAG: methyl-accepting chemotaxis protein [Pseudomonadota bacterium]